MDLFCPFVHVMNTEQQECLSVCSRDEEKTTGGFAAEQNGVLVAVSKRFCNQHRQMLITR